MAIVARYPGKYRHVGCQTPSIPTDAIRIGGGSGYGCSGWQSGQVIRNTARNIQNGGPEWLFVLACTRKYIREDGMSFGVGDENGYLYTAVCRPATPEEAAPRIAEVRAAEARKRILKMEGGETCAPQGI